jgi:predicted nucleotidyltransferase
MLALSDAQLNIVRAIVARRLPGVEARVFGSRARGDARAMSDLDILILSTQPMAALDRALLRDDFSESNLPFRVDIVDASTTSPDFLRAIQAESLPLQ